MAKKTQKAEPSDHIDLAGKVDVLATLVSAQCGLLTEDGADWNELRARAEKIAGAQPAQAAQDTQDTQAEDTRVAQAERTAQQGTNAGQDPVEA